MKSLKIYAAIIFSIFTINISLAQTSINKETIKVLGNCGMCKNTIEKSAKSAGATVADWNPETKFLTVSYDASTSNAVKIQTAIAASGYETRDVKANMNAYNKLHGCCKYDRSSLTSTTNCCAKDKACCDKADAAMSYSKEGKCDGSMCKSVPEGKAACCNKS